MPTNEFAFPNVQLGAPNLNLVLRGRKAACHKPAQEIETLAEAWVNSLIVREQGHKLERDGIAQAIHDGLASIQAEALDLVPAAQPAPTRSRWTSWLRSLSPHNREIDEVVELARDMGRDFDEAAAQRFINHLRNQERAAGRARIARLLHRLNPHHRSTRSHA